MFTIDTERELGLDAVFSLTTQINLPIWEVSGVETKATGFALVGTGASQRINVWVPDGQGLVFTSTNAFITDFDARGINSGITHITIAGANQKVDDKVAFSTLQRLYVNNTQSIITGVSAQTITLIDLRAQDTNSTSANVDSMLLGFAANTNMTNLYLDGNNQPRTTASDAAFVTLNALLGIELRVN
jgi:hypothetical protein